MKEKTIASWPGIPVIILNILLFIPAGMMMFKGLGNAQPLLVVFGLLSIIFLFVMWGGYYMVEPNQAAVLSLFGAYKGTVKDNGLRFNNPFYSTKKISLRVRNFESGRLKVNELEGSPIEIAAVVVWKVVDSAEAVFNVDDFESYVHIQSEAALRGMATSYPYDQHEEGQMALRSHALEISRHLREELQDRLAEAGIEIVDTRISHLAYAPEIAHAMLQRQQAAAIIAARTKIVEGAVGMVEMALDHLKAKNIIDLDGERRAAMVSNLLVVLCSDRATQPVVNTGSLYS